MKRNYGIDFLRILSMFMVVVLHVLGQGYLLGTAPKGSLNYWVAWLLEISCYCAVDCFALISGYVMWCTKPRISRAVNLWLQTFFYTVIILLLFFLFRPDLLGISSIINAVFPITRYHYWYISCYFGLLVLSPLLNIIIRHSSKFLLVSFFAIGYVLFCIMPHGLLADPYRLSNGYSLLWLAILYLAGGYLCKYQIPSRVKNTYAYLTAVIMIILTFASKFILEEFPQSIYPTAKYSSMFIASTSPSIILVAVSLLILCSKKSFGSRAQKLIKFLSPAALGVYLIHTNQLVWQHIIKGFSADFPQYSCPVMVLMVLCAALGIYTICTLIELFRIWLFRIIGADRLCQALEAQIIRLLHLIPQGEAQDQDTAADLPRGDLLPQSGNGDHHSH